MSISLVLILYPITFLSSNPDIWFIIQKRNDVTLPEKEIKVYDVQITSFFKGESKDLDFLTPQENSHMQDVRNLVTNANLLFFISLILFLSTSFYLRKTKFIGLALRKVSLFLLVFLFLLLIVNLIGFDSFFLKFHQMFFVGNYAFPSTSMLKILYPDGFFRDIFILYFIFSVSGCLLTLLASYKIKGLKNRK